MDSGDKNKRHAAQPEHTGSFFLDGLTFAPGAGSEADLTLPEPTEEFRFLKVLGVGGMGIVYEAEELRTGRHVALKVIAPKLRLSEEAVSRFEREARSSASLSHPNCVFVYGAYRVGKSPAIAMELMSGDTLDDRIKRQGGLEVTAALNWTLQMLEGLQAAHDSDLVHRDVKPSNVFIDHDNMVKIGDFGLTRSTEGNLTLTQSGAFLGSPLYASPEQIRGRELDRRSDIYSVGATLYALLAGRAPHTSTNIGDLFARITSDSPEPLREHRPDVPLDLERVIMRALAKEPSDRYEDCDAFQRALRPFTSTTGNSPRLLLRFAAYMIDVFLFANVPYLLWEVFALISSAEERGIRLGSGESPEATWFGEGVFLLYMGLSEGLTGTSLGKKLLGLHVVNEQGGRPGILRATARTAILECTWAMRALSLPLNGWESLRYVPLFSTMRKRNGMRGIHELVTGTRVIELKDSVFKQVVKTTILNPVRTGVAGHGRRCGHYTLREQWAETSWGRLWSGDDDRLGREVWVIEVSEGAGVQGAPESGTLHFLDRVEEDGRTHLVFEAPGGASLLEYSGPETALSWPTARLILIDLLQILASDPGFSSVEKLWISSKGQLRLLPFAFTGQEVPSGGPAPVVVRAIFGLNATEDELPEDIPSEAKGIVTDMLAAKTTGSVAARALEDLREVDAAPRTVSRGIRTAQLFLTAWPPLMVASGYLTNAADEPQGLRDVAASVLIIAGTIVLPGVLLATIFRGGLCFQLFGIRVVDERAHRSSRLDCALRAAITWLPLFLIVAGGHIALIMSNLPIVKFAVAGLLLAYVAAGAWSIYRPDRSLADSTMGTHLVR